MRRLAPLIAALAAITVIVALALVLRGGESDEAPSTAASPTGVPTSDTASPPPPPSPSGPVVAFLGSYLWQEQPGAEAGTRRRHVLYLTQASTDGRAAIGSLVTEGPDVGDVWPVTAQVTSDGVEVSYSDRKTAGGQMTPTQYAVDDLLFTLLGPADAPRTRLGALSTENRHAAEGDYFVRFDGPLEGSTPTITEAPGASASG